VNMINVFDPNGNFLFKFGPKNDYKLSYPRGVTVTPSGK
jgi:DNA-binding beta-propeller fold protein YncE